MYLGSSSLLVCTVTNTKTPCLQLPRPLSLLRRGLFVAYGKSKGSGVWGEGKRTYGRGTLGREKRCLFLFPSFPVRLLNFKKYLLEFQRWPFAQTYQSFFFSENFVITSTIPWLAVLVLTVFQCTEDLSKSAWCRICLERDRSLTGKG